jgi:pimeloyl-ACP methyl ester carboxylesterase
MSENSNEIRLIDYLKGTIAVKAFDQNLKNVPIFFIHGITASVNFWEKGITEYVRNNHPWFSVSLPGHFPSKLAANLKLEQINDRFFYDALDAVLREMTANGEKAIIAGHSTGGFMALNYAAKNPEKVAGVISIGGFGIGEWTGLEGNLQKLARGNFLEKLLFHAQILLMKSSRWIYRRAAGEYVTDKDALYRSEMFEATLNAIYPHIKQHTNRAMYYLFHQIPLLDIMNEIKSINAPTLLLIGEKDPIIPLAHSLELTTLLPNAEQVVFKNTGHLPFVEKKAEFDAALNGWLQKHFPK